MCKSWNIIGIGSVTVAVMLNQTLLATSSIGEAIRTVADRLQTEQITEGLNSGSWPDEAGFTGSIVAGMVSAYELTCESGYKSSAELGGDYILSVAQGNFFGDEAFALTRLSQITADPGDNSWRTAVVEFYRNVKNASSGTDGYIAGFSVFDPSTAVFYVSNHVVAAYYAGAEDRRVWRQRLIESLSRVDDSCVFPVMALGAATWALALTGPLDETIIDPSGQGVAYWSGKKLADLPGLLTSHQVPDGQPNAGSFYWQFGHADDSPSGFTEDTILGTCGLVACSWASPDPDLDSAVLAARAALLDGISAEGKVSEHLSQEGLTYYVYAGEMLEVLGEIVIPEDLNLDGGVNSHDFTALASNWRASDCSRHCWCDGADLDQSGEVDFVDLQIMLDKWFKGTSD
jgi:hypothetical protein